MSRVLCIVVLFSFFLMISCGVSDSEEAGEIEVLFSVTDTTGVESVVFRSGEMFDVTLVLTNHTGKDLEYTYSGPTIYFEILREDSVVTSSIYGLAWPAIVLKGVFKNGTQKTSTWRAPISPEDEEFQRTPVLERGGYMVSPGVSLHIEGYTITTPADIEILILL